MFIGTIMTISKDRVKPSPMPDSWKLSEIFATGVILGTYLAMMTVIFFWAAYKTNFFPVSEFLISIFLLGEISHVYRTPPDEMSLKYYNAVTVLTLTIFYFVLY